MAKTAKPQSQHELKMYVQDFVILGGFIADGLSGNPFQCESSELDLYQRFAKKMGCTLVFKREAQAKGFAILPHVMPVGYVSGDPGLKPAPLFVLECQCERFHAGVEVSTARVEPVEAAHGWTPVEEADGGWSMEQGTNEDFLLRVLEDAH